MSRVQFRSLIFVFTLIVCEKSFAAESFPSGIYVGLGGGYNKTSTRMEDITALESGATPFTISGQKKDLSTLTITGFLGYFHIFKKYSLTLGGELFWVYPKGDQDFQRLKSDPANNNVVVNINSKLHQRYEYGFKLMPGYLIDRINHVYGLLGVSNKNFNETNQLTSPDYGGTQIPYSKSLTKNFSKTYFLVGLGYERAANKVRYGIEGFYQFGNKKTAFDNSVELPAAGTTVTANGARKIENSYTILFKVSYNFNVFG